MNAARSLSTSVKQCYISLTLTTRFTIDRVYCQLQFTYDFSFFHDEHCDSSKEEESEKREHHNTSPSKVKATSPEKKATHGWKAHVKKSKLEESKSMNEGARGKKNPLHALNVQTVHVVVVFVWML